MKKEIYVEIVHMSREMVDEFAKFPQAKRIQKLDDNNKVVVHYLDSNVRVDENFPDIPKDTPIRLGGTMWEICVIGREFHLKSAGYTDVKALRSYSLC